MLTIVRFNWPFYLVAAMVLVASIILFFTTNGVAIKWASGCVLLGAAYFVVVSLGVSHYVYDRSDLYRWAWLERALRGTVPERAIVSHSGFDEVSVPLRERDAAIRWVVLDHFDERTMTEPSIRRARRSFPPASGTIPSPFDRWPLQTGSSDVVFGILAIHEFRTEPERSAWFAEAKRCLRPGGRVILVEHLRDLPNFLAFGPGFVHFHSPSSWRRSWEAAGMQLRDEFKLTPWLRVFILSTP